MLIPSIDLMGGRVVQLEQGERVAMATDDLDGWIARFQPFPLVQLIDLDAAMGRAPNDVLVGYVCARLPCQVGGGIRTVDRARAALNAGARRVILGSALFTKAGVNIETARGFAAALGNDPLVAAIDSREGCVAVNGWKTLLPVAPADAARELEPYVSRFLYTHIETEGLLTGLPVEAIREVASATHRPLIAAGGIRSQEEIDRLHALGIDAVVGMAIYRGLIGIGGVRREA